MKKHHKNIFLSRILLLKEVDYCKVFDFLDLSDILNYKRRIGGKANESK